MTKAFDPKKPVQTRDGLPARIICTDRKYHSFGSSGEIPLVVLIMEKGQETIVCRPANGRCCDDYDSNGDIINIPQKREGFVNIYPREIFETIAGTSPVYPSKEAADHGASPHRIACVRIEWEE
jgi:hypothetical protein